jgi:hypothetical protein
MRRLRLARSLFFALALSACASADPLDGTWRQPNGTTSLPDGTPLSVDATLDLQSATSTFDLDIVLAVGGLTDSIDARGAYIDGGDELTLRIDAITVTPESGNTAYVADDGSQCVVLMGFGGANVCFPTPQTNPYTLSGDTLAITIDQSITGAPVSETRLTLTRVQ